MKLEEVLATMSPRELDREIEAGGRFVVYTWCFSVIVMTFRRSSDVYFLRVDDSSLSQGWKYMLISFLFGWWGLPWGIIYTLQSLFSGISPKNVTADVMNKLAEMISQENSENAVSEVSDGQ